MAIVITGLIALVFALLIFFSGGDQGLFWSIITFLVPTLSALITFFAIHRHKMISTQYLGDYVLEVVHYEPWDELVTVEKTREVTKKDSFGISHVETESYWVDEVKYHPDEYYIQTYRNYYKSEEITDDIYKYVCELWEDVEEKREDAGHYYHTINGDKLSKTWNYDESTCIPVTRRESFKNKVKASESLFNLKKITKKEAKELDLYDYPLLKYWSWSAYLPDQNCIIGMDVSDEIRYMYRVLNAVYGVSNKFRLYILVFEDKDIEISEKQRSYWHNGNPQELVVCLGIHNGIVKWCNPFSWSDKPMLEGMVKKYFVEHPRLDLVAFHDYLTGPSSPITKYWVPKDFHDFDYLKVGVSPVVVFVLLAATVVFCVAMWFISVYLGITV